MKRRSPRRYFQEIHALFTLSGGKDQTKNFAFAFTQCKRTLRTHCCLCGTSLRNVCLAGVDPTLLSTLLYINQPNINGNNIINHPPTRRKKNVQETCRVYVRYQGHSRVVSGRYSVMSVRLETLE